MQRSLRHIAEHDAAERRVLRLHVSNDGSDGDGVDAAGASCEGHGDGGVTSTLGLGETSVGPVVLVR